jgi:hypothetical protein
MRQPKYFLILTLFEIVKSILCEGERPGMKTPGPTVWLGKLRL